MFEDEEERIDDFFEEETDPLEDEEVEETDDSPVREDKIFNNRYKFGEGIRDEDDIERSSKININSNYSDVYLKDIYEYEESLDYNIGVGKVFEFIETDPELKSLLHKLDKESKIKLSKDEINWCFNRILNNIDGVEEKESFYSPIYVLEAISSILNINSGDPVKDYRKIFDCLEVEIQEELILELNKKYNFLDNKINKKRIH
jgi:hypothetical protein